MPVDGMDLDGVLSRNRFFFVPEVPEHDVQKNLKPVFFFIWNKCDEKYIPG